MQGQKHIFTKFARVLLLSIIALFISCISVLPTYAATHPKAKPAAKAELALNIQQGPLGVSLTLSGKGFHPGHAGVSYVDAQNSAGVLTSANDSGVQIAKNGAFSAIVYLPNSGPSGSWRIMVTDSARMIAVAQYTVLAAPGSALAGVPTFATNPTSGKAGDVIAFTGNNWLPPGVRIQLSLANGSNTTPLQTSPVTSDKDGVITGAFRLPAKLDAMQPMVVVAATDGTGSLRAQTHLLLLIPSPTPSASPTPTKTLKAAASTTDTNTTDGTRIRLSGGPLLMIALLVGSILGVAALMLILFVLPWGGRSRKNQFYNSPTSAMTVPHPPVAGDPGNNHYPSNRRTF